MKFEREQWEENHAINCALPNLQSLGIEGEVFPAVESHYPEMIRGAIDNIEQEIKAQDVFGAIAALNYAQAFGRVDDTRKMLTGVAAGPYLGLVQELFRYKMMAGYETKINPFDAALWYGEQVVMKLYENGFLVDPQYWREGESKVYEVGFIGRKFLEKLQSDDDQVKNQAFEFLNENLK